MATGNGDLRSVWRLGLAGSLLALAGCGGGGETTSSAASTPLVTAPVVAQNRAPVVASANANQSATVGASFQYDASKAGTTFTDADGDTLTYRTTIAPAGSGLTATGAALNGTPTPADTLTVTITADDGRGGSVSNSFSVTVQSATLGPALPAVAFLYADASINLPRHFTTGPGNPAGADNTPVDNAVTNAGATLGRVLFYDKRLSINDTVSCASCHQQSLGFSDARRLSIGFQGGLTDRHAMGLANARYYQPGKFFWDERAATAEIQMLQPIQNSVEMGNSLPQLVSKLSAVSFYGPLFTAAFGDSQVTSDRIAKALAQYVRAILSYRSKFDQAFVNGAPNFAATFTAQEEQGRQLFDGVGRCNTCHGTVAQISDSAKNNGLDAVITDVGAGGGRFKAPSLRNIAVRPPYMHDGRFSTLRQVIDHYDSGVKDSATLAPGLRAPDGTVKRLNLTEADKVALEAFLGTLTDTALLTDPKFSDPFPH